MNFTCDIHKVTIDEAYFEWSSDTEIANMEYKLNDNPWDSFDNNTTGTSGIIRLGVIDYDFPHVIIIKATDTTGTVSDEIELSFRTADIGRMLALDEFVFGEPMKYRFSNPDVDDCKLLLTVRKANGSYILDNPPIDRGVMDYTINPDQDMWDSIYKLFGKDNYQYVEIILSTETKNDTYIAGVWENIINLTGNAKVSHTGDNNRHPLRAKIFVGNRDGKPRRAVSWVGEDNDILRTI